MKLHSILRNTAMKFVTPTQYTASNKKHFLINSNAVYDFLKVYQPLTHKDRVLDFGCGTGETTSALARGELGELGKPGYVLGVDISQEMIEHCEQNHVATNLAFNRLDVESSESEAFCAEQDEKFDMVTSFSCLHWVPNQPAAVGVFGRLLKPGGKFLFVIASTQNPKNNGMLFEYNKMKAEPEWAELLKPTTWPYMGTVHRNNSWMTTVNKDGIGPIVESDYVKLMENSGFKVAGSKSLALNYVFQRDFTRNFFKSKILTGFPQLQGEGRKAFLDEYLRRLKTNYEYPPPNGEDFTSYVDGIQLFGEKL